MNFIGVNITWLHLFLNDSVPKLYFPYTYEQGNFVKSAFFGKKCAIFAHFLFFVGLFSKSFVVQDVRRYSASKQDEEETQPPHLGNIKSTVKKGYPHKTHRYNLHTQGYSLMLAEILYIMPQMRMGKQPII